MSAQMGAGRRRLAALGAILLLTCCGLAIFLHGAALDKAPVDDRPRVVAALFPYYDFARAVGGDRINLTMVLKPGTEAHTFDPTPQDMITIKKCNLFIYTGAGNDVWAEKLLESVKGDVAPRVLRAASHVALLKEEHTAGMADEANEGGGEGSEEFDEHIWTSPRGAEKIVAAIREALISVDPENAAIYRSNAKAYLAELRGLDEDFRRVMKMGKRRTIVVGDRFPFRYLAHDYGIRYFAAFPGCSAECEPSASTTAFLIDKVKSEKIPAVFHLELSNESTAKAICAETGAEMLTLHSCHNVSRDDFSKGVTCVTLMRKNLVNLKKALN